MRELAAVIDRAAILGDGKRLDVATALGVGAVPPPPSDPDRPRAAPAAGAAVQRRVGAAVQLPPQQTAAPQREIGPLDDAIRRHIEAALTLTRGRIEGRQGAAALLQINPHTLRARMRKLGIDWARFRDAGDLSSRTPPDCSFAPPPLAVSHAVRDTMTA